MEQSDISTQLRTTQQLTNDIMDDARNTNGTNHAGLNWSHDLNYDEGGYRCLLSNQMWQRIPGRWGPCFGMVGVYGSQHNVSYIYIIFLSMS